jgi:hypothetical protein
MTACLPLRLKIALTCKLQTKYRLTAPGAQVVVMPLVIESSLMPVRMRIQLEAI